MAALAGGSPGSRLGAEAVRAKLEHSGAYRRSREVQRRALGLQAGRVEMAVVVEVEVDRGKKGAAAMFSQ